MGLLFWIPLWLFLVKPVAPATSATHDPQRHFATSAPCAQEHNVLFNPSEEACVEIAAQGGQKRPLEAPSKPLPGKELPAGVGDPADVDALLAIQGNQDTMSWMLGQHRLLFTPTGQLGFFASSDDVITTTQSLALVFGQFKIDNDAEALLKKNTSCWKFEMTTPEEQLCASCATPPSRWPISRRSAHTG